MQIKFDVFWKKNLGTLYKDNSIDVLGKEAVADLDLREVSNIHVNFKVNDKSFTDLVEIVDIGTSLIRIPFKTDVIKLGTNELELVATMKNGDVKPSQTFTYTVDKSLENPNAIEADTNYPVLIELLDLAGNKLIDMDKSIQKVNTSIENMTNEISNYKEATTNVLNSDISSYKEATTKELENNFNNYSSNTTSNITRVLDNKIVEVDNVVSIKSNELDTKFTTKANEITKTLNSEINKVNTTLANKVNEVDRVLENKANEVDEALDTTVTTINAELDKKSKEVDNKVNAKIVEIDNRVNAKINEVDTSLNNKINEVSEIIEEINKEVENTTGRQVDLENTFDQLVINAGNSNAEIVDARVKSDGTSYSKLGDRLNEVDSQLAHNTNYLDNKKLDKNGIVTMANMGQDIKEAMTGGSVAVIGKNTVLEANIVDKQVTPTKTSFCEEISNPIISYELFKTLKTWEKGSMYHLDTGVISSTQYTTNYIYSEKIDCAEETEYKVVSTTINNGQVLFWNDDKYLGFNYLTETGNAFTTLSNANKMAFNIGDYNYPYEEIHIKRYDYSNVDISIPKLKILKDNIEKDVLNTCIDGDVFIKYPYLTSDDNLNDILKSGRYFSIEAQNQPTSGSYHLDVREYKTVYTNPAFITQTLTKFESGDMYIRTIYNNNFTEWKKVLFETNSTRKIVNFGDSIFGNTNNNTSISSYMSEILGADCFNAGFGGCRMAQRSELHWNAFGMSSIAYSIANNNWTLQDSHIDNTSLPSYFKGKLTQLKEINFNEVDLITIAYGTNDYYSTLEMDNEFDKYDKNTFLGALRYSVKTILEKYPHLKILVISPIWRGFVDEEYDSDTKDFGTGTLVDYYIAMEKTCKELKIPFLNSYCESGINAITKDYFFNSDDYTHPIEVGRKRYAELISGKIKTL